MEINGTHARAMNSRMSVQLRSAEKEIFNLGLVIPKLFINILLNLKSFNLNKVYIFPPGSPKQSYFAFKISLIVTTETLVSDDALNCDHFQSFLSCKGFITKISRFSTI